MKQAGINILALAAASLVSLLSVAQDSKPRSTAITISVIQRSESEPKEHPFASVGLFELLLGDDPFDKGRCPSKSNRMGIASCRVICDPDDFAELTLVLRPPGSDAVPGYEVPVSQELSLVGCALSDTYVKFAYTPLEVALRETLRADPELRQAVAMNAPTLTFASLKPFEQSRQPLAALIARKPDDPNVARFARILQDASVSGSRATTKLGAAIDAKPRVEFSQDPRRGLSAKTAGPGSSSHADKVRDLSVGVQSIYLNTAATRSFGPARAAQLAPITTDPAKLEAATHEFKSALEQKPKKTPSDQVLHKELSKVAPGSDRAVARQPPKIEWAKVYRETKPRK